MHALIFKCQRVMYGSGSCALLEMELVWCAFILFIWASFASNFGPSGPELMCVCFN